MVVFYSTGMDYVRKVLYRDCFILTETGCYRMMDNTLVQKAKNFCSQKQEGFKQNEITLEHA